jgi:hypothetical protein
MHTCKSNNISSSSSFMISNASLWDALDMSMNLSDS